MLRCREAAEGELIGVIGNDLYRDHEIGARPANSWQTGDGRLYLTVNRSGYSDARGAFRVSNPSRD